MIRAKQISEVESAIRSHNNQHSDAFLHHHIVHHITYLEQVGVVVQIKVVKAQSHALVDSLEGRPSLCHDGDGHDVLGNGPALKAGNGSHVLLLGHAIVQHGLDDLEGLRGQCGRGMELIPQRPLEAVDLREAARRADGDGVGREGRREGHARTELDGKGPAAAAVGLVKD